MPHNPGYPPTWIKLGERVIYTDKAGQTHGASVTYYYAPYCVDLEVYQGASSFQATAVHELYPDEPQGTPSRYKRQS